jgi:hypothetical protein
MTLKALKGLFDLFQLAQMGSGWLLFGIVAFALGAVGGAVSEKKGNK